ncbi:DUF5916 domain-containing protein [Flavobacterium terrigena]|uniref:Carbohydrate family 9 binding domain-like n=1 Tax=Flavobacterium terrigena TaxID=402734 RepID=A0A1H6X7T4_9FLAO|nr:DUF5916 domain-containing protein [Flavobacterium terrigena]SEJ20615.1 Carbohydrate family 9 binding domain-like [Flavobacterium terrigena]
MKLIKLIGCLVLFSNYSFAQEEEKKENTLPVKRKISTVKSKNSIKIDANLNEADWANAPVANDFIMMEPDNGKPEPAERKTEVKVLYDDDAIYIGAILYDDKPLSILKEITERDKDGTSDYFGVFINGFNDGQQSYTFYVGPTNCQSDCVQSAQGEDYSWDAIWSSETKITDKGWVVEMRIPYAALRFSGEEKQTWGINFFREVRKLRHTFTWNKVDNKAGNLTQQSGILEGIENINTPTRLFLIPYSSFYLNSPAQEKAYGTIKGGLDLKYGLTDAFTLDMVLIPDFGQTKFDNKILNLGPFEQVLNENRPFFTEGTDLFNKGGLFYSRRIGGKPTQRLELGDNEEIIESPSAVGLLNATKISGRTKNGLGIGFLNAVTENTNVVIRDTITKNQRVETIEPLANYNVLVFDQRFNGNSSVSLINTNVTRNGEFRDSNVTATVFNLNTKKNTYNASGAFRYSYVNSYKNFDDKKGISTNINLAETAGKIRYSIGGQYISEDFDNNDLGVNFQTNYFSLSGNVNYRILKSTDKLNSFRVNFNTYVQFDNRTNYLQDQNFNINLNFTNKKNHSAGFGMNVNPFERHDFYNPRVKGRYVIFPKNYNTWVFISSNYNNKFAFDIEPNIGFAEAKGWWFWGLNLSPRYRFNDRFTLIYRNNFYNEYQDLGRVDRVGDDIVFAKRDNRTVETGLEGKYSITSRMNFGLNVRQYWSFSENHSYHKLLDNGYVEDYAYAGNANENYSSWNYDLTYSWWFAPGSQMTILYRNNAEFGTDNIDKNFNHNLKTVFNNDQLNHTFSISLRYFIDYNQAKNVFKS